MQFRYGIICGSLEERRNVCALMKTENEGMNVCIDQQLDTKRKNRKIYMNVSVNICRW